MKKRYEYLILFRRSQPTDTSSASIYRWDSTENRIYTYSPSRGGWEDNFPYNEASWRNLLVAYEKTLGHSYFSESSQCRAKRAIRGINPALVVAEGDGTAAGRMKE